MLDHFAGAHGNICSALVQKNVCRTPTPSADAATGRQRGAVKRGWSREAKKRGREVGEAAGEAVQRERADSFVNRLL